MISAIVSTLNDERRLGATLSSLVPAAMDAFVREVIVADQGSTDQTLEIAHDAGAKVTTGPDAFRDALQRARQPWLLILPAGAQLDDRWQAAAEAHALDEDAAAARLQSGASRPWFVFWGGSTERRGLLIPRTQCLALTARDRASAADLIAKSLPGRKRVLRVLAASEA
jgi:glycosyltransferase involved in cell wall biosynthesis